MEIFQSYYRKKKKIAKKVAITSIEDFDGNNDEEVDNISGDDANLIIAAPIRGRGGRVSKAYNRYMLFVTI